VDLEQNLGIWQKVEIILNLKIRVVFLFSTDFLNTEDER